jgi:hypothetical protein
MKYNAEGELVLQNHFPDFRMEDGKGKYSNAQAIPANIKISEM